MTQAPYLEITGLRVLAPSGRCLLELPALSLLRGHTLGVRGASGAGKSTLLRAMMGLETRCSGAIRWGETDLLAVSPAARAAFRRENIGPVFQTFELFDELTAVGNAGLHALFHPKAERRRLEAEARARLSALGIADETRRASTFSGGERQRIALARALAHAPPILLADEPTAALPQEAGQAVIDALLSEVTTRQATLVVVSHDDAVLARMDQVLTLAHGRPQDEAAS